MAKPVSVDIPHALGAAEARRRIEAGFGQLEQRLSAVGVRDVEKAWRGDELAFTAQAMGQRLTGRLTVFPEAVRIELELPALLGMVAEKLKGGLREQGRLMLEKK